MKRHSYVILDLQYGSTGKGLLAGYLAKREKPDGVVCAFGPNAGHTFVDADGKRFVHIMMPMGVLSPDIKRVFIGPGAIINPEIMQAEHEALQHMGYQYDLIIHENAAVVQPRHRLAEAEYGARIGSTQKGTGAALAEKITRKFGNMDTIEGFFSAPKIIARDVLPGTPLEGFVVTTAEYNDLMDKVGYLQIEGAQGFSLSVHHGFYPFVTSRDCTLAALLSDCAVPLYGAVARVYGVCRTYPIRVNNKTGWSGPYFPDQEEIAWADIGREPELTTVTKLPRRIFTFSEHQIKDAIRMNAVDNVFLNFVNYCKFASDVDAIIKKIESAGPRVRWTGSGPSELDVCDHGERA